MSYFVSHGHLSVLAFPVVVTKIPSHRVGRVLSFFPVVGIGTPQTPHPQASVPPPPVLGGGAHSLAREGLGESRNSDEGTYTVVLFICTCFVSLPMPPPQNSHTIVTVYCPRHSHRIYLELIFHVITVCELWTWELYQFLLLNSLHVCDLTFRRNRFNDFS
jgi:hypothetical protein